MSQPSKEWTKEERSRLVFKILLRIYQLTSEALITTNAVLKEWGMEHVRNLSKIGQEILCEPSSVLEDKKVEIFTELEESHEEELSDK